MQKFAEEIKDPPKVFGRFKIRERELNEDELNMIR